MPEGHPRELVETVLDGFRAVVPAGWTVTHARGAEIETLVPDPDGPDLPRRPAATAGVRRPRPSTRSRSPRRSRSPEAADYAVVVARRHDRPDGRGLLDRHPRSAGRPGRAARRPRRDRHPRRRSCSCTPSPPSCRPSASRAAAVIEAFNPGMRGGRAVAELVLGLIEPAGRLPLSVPRHVGQQPVYYNQVRGQHGRPLRRPHPGPAVRLRRGADLHDGRVVRPHPRRGRPHDRRRRRRRGHPHQHGRAAGARDRAGLRQRRRHERHVGEQGAQGLPAGRRCRPDEARARHASRCRPRRARSSTPPGAASSSRATSSCSSAAAHATPTCSARSSP